MTNRIQTGLVLSVLVLGVAGCNSDSRLPSVAPSPMPPLPVPPSASTYTLSNVTLSGMVFEETLNGRAPIEHASVYCEPCGVETHTWAYTDSNGFYTFTGVWTDPSHFPTRILITKEGYADPVGLPKTTPPNPAGPGWREVVVNGDTRFDAQLVRK
jgi:hypothetical protein